METDIVDPYEQQLLKVFQSHDQEGLGALDRSSLVRLCNTLQLEEQSDELIKCLLTKKELVNFVEFKEALLNLLGSMQNNEVKSPEREVSPKIYGSKKYGRRSRTEDMIKEDKQTSPVQRSNSEVSSKKRKPNKLKRSNSLLGWKEFNDRDLVETELFCTEDMLREAWRKLGVGHDGYLNQRELILVCDAIGLHKLADGVLRQLSDKVDLEFDRKISFQELLEALQQDEAWFEVLNPTMNSELFPDSRTFQYLTLGPDGSGLIQSEALIAMWEAVGIQSPKQLLQELGLNTNTIQIAELAQVLEKQLKHNFEQDLHLSSQYGLLQANLTLYQTEIKCLKGALEQLQAEKEKLKFDVAEANNRATLLAQEVDDNHSKMERNTLNQVRVLEQRHNEMVKELLQQHSKDKDHLSGVNKALEDKIALLEVEVSKLKNDLGVAQKYSEAVEKENQFLVKHMEDLERDKRIMGEKIEGLEEENRRVGLNEFKESEMLLVKLNELRLENASLKDKNDEMESHIEGLYEQLKGKGKGRIEESMEEEVGVRSKRRNDYSPSKDNQLLELTGGSPRLGKVRKFHTDHEIPFASSESGFDTEDTSLSNSANDNYEETTRLQAKVVFLEQILKQHSIPLPSYDDLESTSPKRNVELLTNKIKQLEDVIKEVKNDISRLIVQDIPKTEALNYIRSRLRLNEEECDQVGPKKDAEIQTDPLEETDWQMKCSEYENCIELLRNEIERTEDYWQSKIDEERQIFEQEQKQTSDTLTDLLVKLKEYEDQYADTISNRLPPIEEKFSLEKQFTDLESEFEEYREQSEAVMESKDIEIELLKQKLTEIALKKGREVGVQADVGLFERLKGFSSYVIESTSRCPEEMVPSWEERSEASGVSMGASCSSLDKSGAPCRPKRTRKHDKNLYKKADSGKKRVEQPGCTFVQGGFEQNVILPVSSLHNLNNRRNYLEQRVRHLQLCLKQQHYHNEQTMQHYWQQFRSEKAEYCCKLKYLQEKLEQQLRINNEQSDKLERSDLLVKELYVENSYLIARVQRLEQQCDLLAQCNPNSL